MPHNTPNIEMWDKVMHRCLFLSKIYYKIENREELTSGQLRKLIYFASKFGEEGKKRISLIAFNLNVDVDIIKQYWAEAENKDYSDSAMCDLLCGKNNHCKAIRAVGREDPFELPINPYEVYDESIAANFFCSYFVDRVLYHLGTNRFYEFKEGYWQKLSEDKLGMILERLLITIYPEGEVKNSGIEALIKRLKKVEDLFFGSDFNEDRFVLNFKNGLFDLRSQMLLPHNPDHKSTVQFPVEYDPNADCPLFKEKMLEIFEGNQEVINHILKWMMYTLMPTYEFQKALLLLGKGGNGKSVLTDVWASLLGHENISNQELGNLVSDRHYSVYQLIGKYANFSREVSSLEKDSHIFKMLTGNDLMAARQIYGKPVDFRNKARLVISANAMPSFKTIDQAILRRFEIVKFNKRFDKIADTLLSQKLIRELPGILNLVLEKSNEIIRPDGSIYFEPPKIVSDNLKLFSEGSDSVAQFVTEICEVTTHDEVEYATLLSVLYKSYNAWCTNLAGENPKTKKVFKEEIEHLFDCNTYQIPSVRAINGRLLKKNNWVLGLRLKESIDAGEALAEPIRRNLGLPPAVQTGQPAEELDNTEPSNLVGMAN